MCLTRDSGAKAMSLTKAGARARLARVPRVRAAVYEGAASTRRTLGWRAPTTYPNQVLGDLTMLRDRSRGAVRNDGFAKGAIDKLVSNIIGTGMKPLCQADDEAFRHEVEELWTRWTDESDADGNLDFYGQRPWPSGAGWRPVRPLSASARGSCRMA